MHRFPVIFLLFASTALAQQPHPVITSVVPNSGPSSGGTKVTITGADFFRCPVAAFAAISACSPGTPPAVLVGSLLALSVTLVDTTRLEVTMPPYPPGAADVSVKVAGFGKVVTATAPKAFTFTGSDTFDPVLLPILTPQTPGASGSLFDTSVDFRNLGSDDLPLLGLFSQCGFITRPFVLAPGTGNSGECIQRSGNPGRIAWLPHGTADNLAVNLRVFDVSRSATNFGTMIPVVRLRDFRTSRFALLQLPLVGNRLTLRVYSLEPEATTVRMRWFFRTLTITLRPGADAFDPAYTVLTDRDLGDCECESFAPIQFGDAILEPDDPSRHIWAFVTATDSETQHITTITPK